MAVVVVEVVEEAAAVEEMLEVARWRWMVVVDVVEEVVVAEEMMEVANNGGGGGSNDCWSQI